MDLGKVKEALIAAREELPEYSSAPLGREPQAIRACRLVSEAIAELEKPAEDDARIIAIDISLGALDRAEYWEVIVPKVIQQYAESYHAKKCAEVLSSAADRAMAVYARDCDGCFPRLSDDCDERCPYIAKIRRAIMEAPRA